MAKEGMLGNIRAENASDRVVRDAKSPLKQRVKNAILTVLLLSWMTWVFAQATKTGKETLKKEPPIHIVANDSVDIAGFRVSQDEAKIYENFLANRGQYGSEQQMTSNYKKRITMNRRKKQLEEKLLAAEREEEKIDQEKDAVKNEEEKIDQEKDAVKKEEEKIDQEKDAVKKEEEKIDLEKAEIERKYEELKQQLFQAREKKLGRALTDKEKSEILINAHKTQ